LIAAPSYLEAHGRPRVPADLKDHACLGFPSHPYWPDWMLTKDGQRKMVRPNCSLVAVHPTLRRAQSLVAARDRSFQSLPCFCQFIRMCRFCGVFLPSVNSCSPTKLKRTMAAGPTTRIVGSLYSSEVHL